MGDESTDRHCEVCGREQEPRKRWIEITEKSDTKTGIDRMRQFVSDTMSGFDRSDHEDTPESSASSDVDEYYEETFYICPHLSCDGREEAIREMERWEMEHSINQEFSEEKLDKIVEEKIDQDRIDNESRIKQYVMFMKMC